MALYSVRLELARTKEFPDGNSLHGYELIAPLDRQGHLHVKEWQRSKSVCAVCSFNKGEDDRVGRLVHVGKAWHFDYDAKSTDDDERLFKLDRHLIKQGEYLSVTEHDGVTRPFRIVSVTPKT